MRDRPNVLIVTGFDLDDPAGGINTMIWALIQNLAVSCRVVVLEVSWDALKPIRDEVGGIVRYRMRLQTPYASGRALRALMGWTIRFPANLLALTRVLKDESIDAVHLHYGSPYQYYFPLVRKLLGIPYVLTLHRGDIINFVKQRWPDRYLMKFAISKADRVLAVSSWLAEEAKRAVGSLPRLQIILNGVDVEELDALYDPTFEDSAAFPVPREFCLMVSNVTHYKAQDVLIRAWAEVMNRHPGLSLLVVGAPRELWDECMRLIAETGCGDSVRLLGAQPRSTAINLMYRAKAVIMPSRSEGLPYVLLEAGAIGAPVVCSDIGPFTEVVENGKTALVTPVEDAGAIGKAVDRIISDPERARAMGQALRTRIRSDFSAANMARQYLSTYESVIAERRAD